MDPLNPLTFASSKACFQDRRRRLSQNRSTLHGCWHVALTRSRRRVGASELCFADHVHYRLRRELVDHIGKPPNLARLLLELESRHCLTVAASWSAEHVYEQPRQGGPLLLAEDHSMTRNFEHDSPGVCCRRGLQSLGWCG